MDVLLVPVNCRLPRSSLETITGYANAGVHNLSVRFDLMPYHRVRRRAPDDDLLQYVSSQFQPFTIAVVSRQIERSEAGETIGLGDAESQVGVVRAESGYRGRMRDENVAQTVVHELLHMIGRDHHTRSTRSSNGLWCPFMSYSVTRETSVVPCEECQQGLRSFAKLYRAA